jgi:hypothetical protein
MTDAVGSNGGCAVLRALIREYSTLTALYSSTVAALSKRVGVRTKADYKALKEEVETVRLTCEDARTAVGCWGATEQKTGISRWNRNEDHAVSGCGTAMLLRDSQNLSLVQTPRGPRDLLRFRCRRTHSQNGFVMREVLRQLAKATFRKSDVLREHVIRPLLAASGQPEPPSRPANPTPVDHHYEKSPDRYARSVQ